MLQQCLDGCRFCPTWLFNGQYIMFVGKCAKTGAEIGMEDSSDVWVEDAPDIKGFRETFQKGQCPAFEDNTEKED